MTARRIRHTVFTLAIAGITASTLADTPLGPSITHGPIGIELQTVASGLVSPDELIPVPGNPNQQLILDQTGKIYSLDGGVLQSAPFMDLSSRLVTLSAGYDERGLLGVAFDPNYATSPGTPGYHTLYTFTSEPVSGAADFTVPINPGTAMNHQGVLAAWNTDTMARQELMRIDEPQSNHNGGTIAFGPDGYLYLGTGDGGQSNDVGNGHNPATGNAQDLTTALGKILRIDVRGNDSANGHYGIPAGNSFSAAGQVKEIYAYGFRNPYRWSFDSSSGNLLVADVGQGSLEEVDRVSNGGNYGWHLREGGFDFDPATGSVTAGPPAPGLIDPILQYDHSDGIAVIGGFVYHGTAIPDLVGKYVFGDLSKGFGAPGGRLFYADMEGPDAGVIHELIIGDTDRALGLFLKGFGQDASGELYVLGSTRLGPSGTEGVAYKIVAVPEPAALFSLGFAALLLARRRRV